MVAYPLSPIETNRQQLIDTVNSWNASGFTPLSETLFEAYRYFKGDPVGFGNTSEPIPSVAESRNPAQADGANYESPADFSCQKNYIVYLTDGLPTSDAQSNTDIAGLPKFAELGGTCLAEGEGPKTTGRTPACAWQRLPDTCTTPTCGRTSAVRRTSSATGSASARTSPAATRSIT